MEAEKGDQQLLGASNEKDPPSRKHSDTKGNGEDAKKAADSSNKNGDSKAEGNQNEEAPQNKGSDGANPLHGKFTFRLILASVAATLGGSTVNGYNTAALNMPEQLIRGFINTSLLRYTETPNLTMVNLVWSITQSIYLVGGCMGAFTFGYLAQKLGRRNGLFVCQIGSFLSAILLGLAKTANSFEMLMVGRLLVGWSAGAGSGLCPLYLTEIAPINLRGSVGVMHQFALVFGILLAQVLGMKAVLGTDWGWPILLALSCAPNVVSYALLPFCPESPRFLLIEFKRERSAASALRLLRNEKDVSLITDEMLREHEAQKNKPKFTVMQLLRTPNLHMPLALVCACNAAQQLTGINAVFCYSQQIFTSANIAPDKSQYATLGTGVVNFIMTAVSIVLVEKAGRRPLILTSLGGLMVCCVLITITLTLQSQVEWFSYCSVVLLILFVVSFSIGLGCIPAFLAAEMFRQGPRGPAMSFAALVNWSGNFLVTLTFPFVQAGIDSYSFLVFGVLAACFFTFLFLKLPETKQKPLEEIYRIFASHCSIPFMRTHSHTGTDIRAGGVNELSPSKHGIDEDMIELAIRHDSTSEGEHDKAAPAVAEADAATAATSAGSGEHHAKHPHPHVTIVE